MSFVIRWYKRNMQASPEQTKIFFRLLPLFLVITFFIAKYFPAVSILWFIIYCVIIVGLYDDKYIENRPAFPLASKFPFFVLSFMIAKFYPILSFVWTIIYSSGFLTAYISSSTKERPAFPYASKFPRVNSAVHSFYLCLAIMGLFWLSFEECIDNLF